MNEKEIRNIISLFSGNIDTAFNLTNKLLDDLKIDLGINFKSSNALQKYTNMIRNMISRGIITQPIKSGRSLILNGRNLLELLVARRYLLAGCSMDSLSGYLVDVATEDIFDRLFAKQLPDIEKIARRNFISINRPDVKAALEKAGEKLEKKYPIYHYIKVKPDIYLHLKVGKFLTSELEEMVSLLTEYLEGRSKTKSE